MRTATFKAPAPKPKRKSSPAQQLKAAFPAFVDYQRVHFDGKAIVLPLPPQMGNWRGQWFVKEAARQAYFGHCRTLAALGLLPEHEDSIRGWPEYSVITVTVYVQRLHDYDNLVARLKFAIDYLEREGYIQSDSPKHLKYSAMPEQVLANGTPPRVEIEITAAPDR